ncbi:hypothetical protein U6G28_09890 [Actinomycetaceae bacterium MB13-C1-2]|nr:hypothetical protein U6G28_09890 [Actinomycetaceae bacterium MB13-C1-2]
MSQERTDLPSINLNDDRRAARGWGRIVPALFWVFGVGTVAIAVWQLFDATDQPVGPRLATLFAGAVYILAALGLTHNGRRMRVVAWSCISISLAGPLIEGLLSLDFPATDVWSPWANFGLQVWFSSLLLPLIGLVWMWWSNPRRIVELADSSPRLR